jgi:hypothetical protein
MLAVSRRVDCDGCELDTECYSGGEVFFWDYSKLGN